MWRGLGAAVALTVAIAYAVQSAPHDHHLDHVPGDDETHEAHGAHPNHSHAADDPAHGDVHRDHAHHHSLADHLDSHSVRALSRDLIPPAPVAVACPVAPSEFREPAAAPLPIEEPHPPLRERHLPLSPNRAPPA
ncbi:MAG: hypothetical protein ABIK96_08735 [bacterium]